MLKLIEITSHALKQNYSKDNFIKWKIYQALDDDLFRIKGLNKEIQPKDPYNFRHNKLLELFTQSKNYIHLNWNSIVDGNAQRLLFKSNGVSWEGTSILNYMQTSMLEILSVIYEAPIGKLNCLKDSENIYQMNTSPNIQSTEVIGEQQVIFNFNKKSLSG